jgi:hypothetical protein
VRPEEVVQKHSIANKPTERLEKQVYAPGAACIGTDQTLGDFANIALINVSNKNGIYFSDWILSITHRLFPRASARMRGLSA